jgi:serine/threonine protein kinase
MGLMDLTEQKKFGRYEIKAEIGRGGMATVYHAYDPRFEREVALKVLPREMLHDLQFRTRFEREAKTIAMLEHPAIVPVYDFGEEDGQPYFVMRYMTGGSLSEKMKKGPMSVQDAAHLMTQIAPALDDAHAKGIIHRDLKPGNILFDQFNEPYISDFGIAKLSASQANVTGSAIIGTPAYMSPEQAQGEGIDGRSDIYGLGVILFEMLTGQQPYHGDTPMSVVVKQITDPVPHILDVRSDLPSDVELIIEKAMAKDRNERFQDVKSLAKALNAVARGESLSLGTSDSTVVASSKTVAATKRPSQPAPGTLVAKRAQVPQIVEPVQAPSAPRSKIGLWIGLGAVVLFLCLGTIVGLYFFGDNIPFLASLTSAKTQPATQASPTLQVVAPTATTAVVSLPVASDTPASTDTPAPSPTPTVPKLPVIGGADQIAFLSSKNIWLVNVDGTEARPLTKDGADKKQPQWAPDGKSLFYISGKCIQNVTVPEGAITTITCFASADFVEAFEISPDGTQVAISVNHILFIVPLDVTALSGARNVGNLANMPGGIFKYPDLSKQQSIKQVRWLKGGKRIAVDSITPTATGQTIDNIIIYDLTSCTSTNQCDSTTFFTTRYVTQFPSGRFDMIGFGTTGGKYSNIPSFDWNAEGLFLLNSINRNGFYGYLYSYNSSTFKGEQVDPLGSQCCYTDARWSPDGSYVLFAYQDIRLGGASKNQLYYIQYGSIGAGGKFTPLPLPPEVLSNIAEHPDPALRPIK